MRARGAARRGGGGQSSTRTARHRRTRHTWMVLSDGVITLRRAAEADVPALVAACQDPEIPRWTAVPSPYTEADARAFLTTLPEERFLIVDADDRLLGAISPHNPDTEPATRYSLRAPPPGPR